MFFTFPTKFSVATTSPVIVRKYCKLTRDCFSNETKSYSRTVKFSAKSTRSLLLFRLGPWQASARKKKNKKDRHILRIWPDAPLPPIYTNLGLRIRPVDIINCAKFNRNRLRGCMSQHDELSFTNSHRCKLSFGVLCHTNYILNIS